MPFHVLAGSYLIVPQRLPVEDVLKLAKIFLNVPYLWGGKNAFGMDCSGFTQVLFKLMGIQLPRDSAEQALMGTSIGSLSEIKSGDLAYFGKESDKITHVGMLMDNQTIIHASGRVRIDRLNAEGIFNKEQNANTHQLQVVKSLDIGI